LKLWTGITKLINWV